MSQSDEPDLPVSTEGSDPGHVPLPGKHRFAFRSDVGEVLDLRKGDDWETQTTSEDTLVWLFLVGILHEASELRIERSVDEDGHWNTACSLTIDKQDLPARKMPEAIEAAIRRRVEREDCLRLELEPLPEWDMWWVVEEIERLAGLGQTQARSSGRFYIRFSHFGIEVLVSIDAWREGIRRVLRFDGCDLSEVSQVDEPDSPAASEGLDPEQVSFPGKHRWAFRSNFGEVLALHKIIEFETLTEPEQHLGSFLLLILYLRASEFRIETTVDEDGHCSTVCSFLTDKLQPPIADMPEEISEMIRRRVERDDGLLLEFEPIDEPEMWWVVKEIERLAGFGHLRRWPAGRFYILIGGHGFEVLVSIDSRREGIRHVLRMNACDLSGVSRLDGD